jgi:hypothetical protein
MQLSIEVLPAPLGPMMARISPFRTSKSISVRTAVPPKLRETFSTVSRIDSDVTLALMNCSVRTIWSTKGGCCAMFQSLADRIKAITVSPMGQMNNVQDRPSTFMFIRGLSCTLVSLANAQICVYFILLGLIPR